MKVGYKPLDLIIEDWLDYSGESFEELDRSLILKFANDAAQRITTGEVMVQRIALLKVDNYKAELPEDFQYVAQAAYRINCENKPGKIREEISEWTKQNLDGCELTISKSCPDCYGRFIEVDVDRIYETANPQLYTKYMSHFSKYGGTTGRASSLFHPQFKLMRPTSSTYFNIPHHIKNCPNLSVDIDVEYTIKKPIIVVNFKCGEILLSYLGNPLSEDGYRMIPDLEIAFRAINSYVEERLAYRTYRRTREQRDRVFWNEARAEAERIIARAREELDTPDPEEFMQFVRNHWKKLIPNWRYESDFNRARDDEFRYPDQTYNF